MICVCTQCSGGLVPVQDDEQDNRGFVEACYHCNGTGKVDEQTAFNDALSEIVFILAERIVQKKAREDEEWGLNAGETGLSIRDFTSIEIQKTAAKIQPAIFSLPQDVKEAMLNGI